MSASAPGVLIAQEPGLDALDVAEHGLADPVAKEGEHRR
jgi:hypothetical protein